jgi:signal peptidase I
MTGSINKGDAIIFEQYKGQELEEGQVIIFYKDNIQTIHRIQDIQLLNGETIYYTKGENNQQKDDGYRIEQDIIGVVKFKLIYIGWPTIWVKQLFST